MENLLNFKLLGFIVGLWCIRRQLKPTDFLFHYLIVLFAGLLGSKIAQIVEGLICQAIFPLIQWSPKAEERVLPFYSHVNISATILSK